MVLGSKIRTSEGRGFVDAHFPRQLRIVQPAGVAKSSGTVRASPPFWSLCSIAAVAASRWCRLLLERQLSSRITVGGQYSLLVASSHHHH